MKPRIVTRASGTATRLLRLSLRLRPAAAVACRQALAAAIGAARAWAKSMLGFSD